MVKVDSWPSVQEALVWRVFHRIAVVVQCCKPLVGQPLFYSRQKMTVWPDRTSMFPNPNHLQISNPTLGCSNLQVEWLWFSNGFYIDIRIIYQISLSWPTKTRQGQQMGHAESPCWVCLKIVLPSPSVYPLVNHHAFPINIAKTWGWIHHFQTHPGPNAKYNLADVVYLFPSKPPWKKPWHIPRFHYLPLHISPFMAAVSRKSLGINIHHIISYPLIISGLTYPW